MSDINFSKLTWENLPARTTALSATNLNRIEKGIDDSVNGVNSNSHSIAELQTRISQVASGSPTPVATVAEMTDESAVYLYTGSETGYTAGNWYYYNGTAWTAGGTYGGAVTDATLSISGASADAKAVGDALADKADSSDVTSLDTRVTAVDGDVLDLSSDRYEVYLNSDSGLILLPVSDGDSITISTADGSAFTKNDQLRFYQADGTYIRYYAVDPSYGSSRTVTTNLSAKAEYVGITLVDEGVVDYHVVNNSNYHAVQARAIQTAFDDIDTEISEVKTGYAKKEIINRFNIATITSGYYLSTIDGSLTENADYGASDYIDVSDLASVMCSHTHIVCFYKADKTFLSGQAFNTNASDSSISVPSTAKYMRFSNTLVRLPNAQIGESVSRDNYVPYGKYTLSGFVQMQGENTIIVDANGNGDYTSLTEALYDNVDTGETIIVMPGTYDIVSEYVAKFGQSAVDNMADADGSTFNGFQYGVIIRNRKIEFKAGSHVVCDWTGHTVDGTHRFSAIRVDYNAEIIGLDLDVTATFYGIHDDYGLATPYTVKYENCRVIGHSLVNADCIGGGCKKYSRHIIKNCYFDNNLTNSATVRYHNTNAEGAEPEIYVSNCYFNNWFTPRYYGSQTSKMKVYVNNCEARSIHKLRESSSYNVDNVDLYKWCCIETNPVTA